MQHNSVQDEMQHGTINTQPRINCKDMHEMLKMFYQSETFLSLDVFRGNHRMPKFTSNFDCEGKDCFY